MTPANDDATPSRGSLDRATRKQLCVIGLVAGAAGILAQFFSGVPGFPTVPPGPIILLVAAATVAFGRPRRTLAVGIAAATLVLLGGFIRGHRPRGSG